MSVDLPLPTYDVHKLPPWLHDPLVTALMDARSRLSAVQLAAGDQAGARGRVKTAHERLADLLRTAHSFYYGIPLAEPGQDPDDETTDEDERLDALVSLGFESGELGDLGDRTHLLQITDAILANTGSLRPLLRVPMATLSRLNNWRAVLVANQNLADGGTREALTGEKDTAADLLARRLARVRLYLAAGSDLGEYDPILARYDFQPKRQPGEAQPAPEPAAPGPFTWDPATRTGTLPELPAHATTIVAWRQILGGEPEPCGQSETPSVNFASVAPFLPGGHYHLWITGHNAAGDGPKSNEIAWTAPV